MNLKVVINDLLIDVVNDDQAAMFLQDTRDCQKFVSSITGAGGLQGLLRTKTFVLGVSSAASCSAVIRKPLASLV